MEIKTVEDIRKAYKILKANRRVLNWGEFASIVGYDRTYISRVLNGHEVLSIDMKKQIEQKLNETKNVPREKPIEQIKQNSDQMDNSIFQAITELARGQIIMAEAHKIALENEAIYAAAHLKAVDTNSELMQILKAKTILVNAEKEKPPMKYGSVAEQVDRIAENGIGLPLKWSSKDEGLLLLGKLIVGDYTIKKEVDKGPSEHN